MLPTELKGAQNLSPMLPQPSEHPHGSSTVDHADPSCYYTGEKTSQKMERAFVAWAPAFCPPSLSTSPTWKDSFSGAGHADAPDILSQELLTLL